MGEPNRKIEGIVEDAVVERAARTITAGLRELVRAEVARFAESSEYYTAKTSPFGSDRAGRRRFNELASSGRVPAVKEGGHWLILKSDMRTYLDKHGEKRGRREGDEDVDEMIERVMKRDEAPRRRSR